MFMSHGAVHDLHFVFPCYTLCLFVSALCLVCPMLAVFWVFHFWTSPTVFSNVHYLLRVLYYSRREIDDLNGSYLKCVCSKSHVNVMSIDNDTNIWKLWFSSFVCNDAKNVFCFYFYLLFLDNNVKYRSTFKSTIYMLVFDKIRKRIVRQIYHGRYKWTARTGSVIIGDTVFQRKKQQQYCSTCSVNKCKITNFN
jgi:hypothetical protein